MSLEDAEQRLRQRQLPQAKAAFDEAEAAGDDANRCAGGRWMVAMLRGDFEAAWRESDALRARGAADPHRMWDGKSLEGKRVIVRCLHGLGDAVQMFRFAPALRKVASSVVWEVAPRLVDLARCFDGLDEVVTWGVGAPAVVPVWDSQVEVMELPYLFRTTQDALPMAERYCRLTPDEVQRAGSRMKSPGPRVGVVWAGGEWDPGRSLPFSALAPLLAVPGLSFWSLQQGMPGAAGAVLRDAAAICGDGLVALAATIANLDAVVTVDTLAAHLAAAMGKPVLLMLQKVADWRWLAEGERSAWYPTMHLFRQQCAGNWAEVVQRVCAHLKEELL